MKLSVCMVQTANNGWKEKAPTFHNRSRCAIPRQHRGHSYSIELNEMYEHFFSPGIAREEKPFDKLNQCNQKSSSHIREELIILAVK